MKSVLLPLVLANSLLFPEYVQCNLWKRVELDSPNAKEKVTIKDILKGLSDGF
jgi:hypothetical protein